MLNKENLKSYIDELIKEVEEELDESSTTGGVDGYQTPFAFSGKGKKDKAKADSNIEVTGYTKVKDIDEAYTSFVSGNSGRTTTHLDNTKYQLTKDVNGVQIGNYNNVVLPKGSIIHNLPGGVFVNHPSLKDKFSGIKETPKFGFRITTKPDTLISIEKSSKILESVNEGKTKRPVNRWLELKNDESMHANKKLAVGLKELKHQLSEVEKFFRWYNQIKTMNELSSDVFWKRTHGHIYKIKERLINIAKTIQEIEK